MPDHPGKRRAREGEGERKADKDKADKASSGARATESSLVLDRGLRVLELLASDSRDLSVAAIAKSLDLNRQTVYRVLHTLADHRLVVRGEASSYHLGAGVVVLAGMYRPHLRLRALPYVRRLAEETSATAHCAVAEATECVTLLIADAPNRSLQFSYREGARHPLDVGASGVAILAGRPPEPDDAPAVKRARKLGYAVSRSQITPGAVGIAAPLTVQGAAMDASVGIIGIGDINVEQCAARVVAAAREIARAL